MKTMKEDYSMKNKLMRTLLIVFSLFLLNSIFGNEETPLPQKPEDAELQKQVQTILDGVASLSGTEQAKA